MKDIFNPGFFEPRINQGKELAVMEKYNPYSGIKVEIGYSPSTPYKTVFRIAEKGIVFEGLNDGGSDIRIPWSEIAGVSANESIIWSLTMVLKLKDGTDCHIFFENWETINIHIHLIRGISRIILDKIDEEENKKN